MTQDVRVIFDNHPPTPSQKKGADTGPSSNDMKQMISFGLLHIYLYIYIHKCKCDLDF